MRDVDKGESVHVRGQGDVGNLCTWNCYKKEILEKKRERADKYQKKILTMAIYKFGSFWEASEAPPMWFAQKVS